jgi:hypothetical protein
MSDSGGTKMNMAYNLLLHNNMVRQSGHAEAYDSISATPTCASPTIFLLVSGNVNPHALHIERSAR